MGKSEIGEDQMKQVSFFHNIRKGLALTEILLAILLTGLTTGGLFFVMSASSRNTVNAYHIYLAEQLAREPLEVLRCSGFNEISKKLDASIGEYQFNRWQRINPNVSESGIRRPVEAGLFERKLSAELIQHETTRGILLKVSVRPLSTTQKSLMSRCETAYSGIIVEHKQ